MIIDSHLHLPVDFPDFPSKEAVLLNELKRNGVERGIVIADSELESVIGSVRDCAELFYGSGIISVIAGISPNFEYASQLDYCRELLESKRIVGLKVYTGHENFYCTDSCLAPVYDLAAEYNVPVLFHSGWDNAHYAAPKLLKELADNRPDNVFVYCHCYYPKLDECFEVLSSCNNVYFDTSSVADDEKLLPQIKSALEKAIHEMPKRFIFGSDFGSCLQNVHLSLAESLDLNAEERELFMHGNAERVYKLCR
ncbi:TatD family hydrolase [Ruminococcus sp.]|jgi:predicted TIM-barrel fold metal-dependent hydrolase|uniref:amidohydrolase family protein n=1 Tax=Ruminococcus sp. TaxID=41978 RepID=UPI0025EE939E|nr:TatD family hydrolase [Ruminococcus sp.]